MVRTGSTILSYWKGFWGRNNPQIRIHLTPAPLPPNPHTESFQDGNFLKLSKEMFLEAQPPLLTQEEPSLAGRGTVALSVPSSDTHRPGR